MNNVVLDNALQAIGNTPLVALDHLYPGPGRLYSKMEFLQPGGSVKDRAARKIMEVARETGALAKGQTVVEMTSGNMGAGLAVVCNLLGHPLVAVMSEGNSHARARMLRALGAELILAPQVDGIPGQVTGKDIAAADARAREIAQERNAFFVDQFNNPASVLAHEEGTGPEIWDALGGKLDAFVAMVGSGGTFVGTSRFLTKRDPKIRCAAVEPEGAEVLSGKPVTKTKHILQGAGYGIVPPLWEPGLAAHFIAVGDEEAADYRHRLATMEGLHVGFSAAANVCAAVKLLNSGALGSKPVAVTVLPDTGLKY